MAAASAPPTTESTARQMCPGTSKQTHRPCGLGAGHGTDHPGSGFCKFHGGSTRNGVVHAARQEAARLGAELQMEPHDALLLTVRRAANYERYCAQRVAALEEATLVVTHEQRVTTADGVTVTTSTKAELNIWVREHQRALDQLGRIAKVAIDAGVDERRIRLEEQLVGQLANAIDALLTDLGVREHPDAPAAVERCLRLVETPRPSEQAA